ncbi:PLP-dependent transferase [Glycomyces paridis]|uniref:PLP-dependent transferase n=1 Tax=Glycomyces paridis TaxID=2126555 RepID=UPI0023D927AE|nr:PLP-dependent transferase [Glycomyces paridis]
MPYAASSLGGVESLVTRPAAGGHSAPDAFPGLPDDLVRFSAGIEAADDLIADLARALAT